MSATFPKVLKRELLSFLKAKELIEDRKALNTEYKKRNRTRIEYYEGYISQNLEEIISCYYEKDKKALIVMNTVKRAQEIFGILQKLFDSKCLLTFFYHLQIKILTGSISCHFSLTQNNIQKWLMIYTMPLSFLKLCI
jgi:CRISPR/Cas system-associated endonuclease/helicase Cas3